MGKRLVIGLLKGLIIGAAIGAGFHFGLGWVQVGFVLGLLIAMGTGATAAVLAGRPPWRREAWIEAGLKAVAGLGVSALLYWLATRYASFSMPFSAPPLFREGTPWTELPLLVSGVTGSLFGALVELDNTDDEGSTNGQQRDGKHQKRAPKARVDATGDELISEGRAPRDRRTRRA